MEKIRSFYLYIMVFTIIYIEFSYQMVITNILPGVVRIGILLTLTFFMVFLYKKIQIRLFLFLLYIFFLIMLNVARGNIADYVLLFIPILIGFIIASNVKIESFIRVYSNIMYFFSIFSLIVYGINKLFPWIIQRLPYLGNVYSYTAEIHNAIFAVAITRSINVRNYGIAWEPGAFSLLICLALFLELTTHKNLRFKRIIIHVITILTTFSTSGYIFIIGMLGVIFNNSVKLSKKECKIIRLGFICALIFFIFMPTSVKTLVFYKLKGLFSRNMNDLTYTTKSRINAIYYPFTAFLSNPIFGVGYKKFSIINRVYCDGVATNTIINWFAVLGISFGFPCLFGLNKFIKYCCKKNKISSFGLFIFLLLFILILSTESLLRISLIYILIFYGFSKKSRLNIKKWRKK